ncbi:hypothetical protein SGO26_29580 (plasmid) [Cupriavidus metallidurans]
MAAIASYVLYAQIFSFIPLRISVMFSDRAMETMRDFFVVYAVVRLTSSWAMTMFPLFRKTPDKYLCAIGNLMCVIALIALTINFKYSTLLLTSGVMAVGEAMFTASYVPMMISRVRRQGNIWLHAGLFTFCTTAIGLGGGQVLGSMIFDQHSTVLSVATWLLFLLLFYFIYSAIYKSKEFVDITQ